MLVTDLIVELLNFSDRLNGEALRFRGIADVLVVVEERLAEEGVVTPSAAAFELSVRPRVAGQQVPFDARLRVADRELLSRLRAAAANVLAVMRQEPDATWKPDRVWAELLGAGQQRSSGRNTQALMRRMADEGDLVKVGHGRYRLPADESQTVAEVIRRPVSPSSQSSDAENFSQGRERRSRAAALINPPNPAHGWPRPSEHVPLTKSASSCNCLADETKGVPLMEPIIPPGPGQGNQITVSSSSELLGPAELSAAPTVDLDILSDAEVVKIGSETQVRCKDERGQERMITFVEAAHACLDQARQIREFPSYRGQKNTTGLCFVTQIGRHVGFESRLERAALVRLDFSEGLAGVSAQPCELRFPDGSRHVPDFFATWKDGRAELIDVSPRIRTSEPKRKVAFARTKAACAAIGWDYRVEVEPDEVYQTNLEWLRAYPRPSLNTTGQPRFHRSRVRQGNPEWRRYCHSGSPTNHRQAGHQSVGCSGWQ